MLRLKATFLLICLYALGTYGADKYTDENRPYEFGFTIDGEQHRHEKKDENGIIMGEFGFITADGVYHVTVYATDEQGRFKILSMKNIRVKPYPTAGVKKGHSLPFPPSGNPPISQGPTTTKPQSQPEIKPGLKKQIASPAKSCSACSLPTTTTKAPQLTDIAVVSKDRIASPQADTKQQAPASSVGAQNNPTAPRRIQNSPQYQQTNIQQQVFVGQQANVQKPGLTGNQNYPQPGFDQNQPALTGYQNPQTSDINRDYPKPSIGQNYQQPGLGGNRNLQTSYINTNYPQPSIGQNYQQPGLEGNQNLQTSDINRNYPQPSIGQNYQQPGLAGNLNFQTSDINRNYPQPSIGQNFQQPGLAGNLNFQTSDINRNYPQTGLDQSQSGLPGNQQGYQQQNNANPNLANGNQNFANQNYPQGQSNENQNYPQTGQPQRSNDIYNNRAGQPSTQRQYKPDSPYVPGNSAFNTGTENSQTTQGNLRNPKQYDDVPSLHNRFGQPQGFRDIIASQVDQPIADKPTLVAAQMQIVPKDTDIHYRGPGEKEGLPNGISVDHVTQLLYTFNYTVGFHGHHEEGYTNGAKQGYYYVTGRNGIRTRVDYVADEKGFRPRISQEVLNLTSDDVPKAETEKDEKFGLKGYEFKWLYFPS